MARGIKITHLSGSRCRHRLAAWRTMQDLRKIRRSPVLSLTSRVLEVSVVTGQQSHQLRHPHEIWRRHGARELWGRMQLLVIQLWAK